MNNRYTAYGLDFSSPSTIPGLTRSPLPVQKSDVQIEIGEMPPWVGQAMSLPRTCVRLRAPAVSKLDPQFQLWEYGGLFFQLRYGDGTSFLVDRDATRVWGQAGNGLSADDVFVYLLGPIMGFLTRRRGRIALHASAVVIGGRAVALTGAPWSGKSTTAAALALRGHPILCEDVCALSSAGGQVQALPGHRRISLWPDSVSYLFSSPDALPLIVRGWEKRYLPLEGDRAKFADESAPLSAIYLLAPRSADKAAPHLDRMSSREATIQLVQNTYMNYLLDKEQCAAEFESLAKLALQAECLRLTPSSDPARLPDLASLIERHALATAGACPPAT